jgi:hypothetical protein
MVLELVFQSSDMVNMNTTTIPSFAIPITEKLHQSNYLLWQAQIMPAIRAAQLEGFLDDSIKKPSKTISKTVGASVVNEHNLRPCVRAVGGQRSSRSRLSSDESHS